MLPVPDKAATELAIAKLRAQAASARDASHFSHVPARCGPFRLRQMLPRDALLLYAIANPIFNGRRAARCRPGEVLAFLFVLCGQNSQSAGWWRRARLTLRLLFMRRRPRAKLHTALDDYVRETFVDCPASGGGSRRDSSGGLRPSFLSSLFHTLAKNYHWSRADLYATPLRELMLYLKHIIADLRIEARQPVDDTPREELELWNEYLVAMEKQTNGREEGAGVN